MSWKDRLKKANSLRVVRTAQAEFAPEEVAEARDFLKNWKVGDQKIETVTTASGAVLKVEDLSDDQVKDLMRNLLSGKFKAKESF